MASKAIMTMKEQLVEEIKQKIQNSSSVVIVGYQGMTAEQDTALRAELRKSGVEYKVLKNRLVRIALNELGYTAFDSLLEGPNAVAFSPASDPVAAAKILKKYADKVETFEIKAGFVDGSTLDKAGVEELAALPSKEQLIAKMLGSLQSSLYGLAYVLQAYVDKQNEETAA